MKRPRKEITVAIFSQSRAWVMRIVRKKNQTHAHTLTHRAASAGGVKKGILRKKVLSNKEETKKDGKKTAHPCAMPGGARRASAGSARLGGR